VLLPLTAASARRCLPGQNVLFVSTIEIRNNHRLLVRVWRRLIARHGMEAVPALIFAGQIGWMVDDLLADLATSGHLGGKIEHRPGLSDEELDEAYRSCLFTVFPSLCEGWGLPKALRMASFALLRIAYQPFLKDLLQGKLCGPTEKAHIVPIELRPNDVASPRMPRRTSDFSPNLERIGCADAWPHYTRT
jgi:glycosyltransferase involved in cell wall biosynthesis